jgi:hypothetical protein
MAGAGLAVVPFERGARQANADSGRDPRCAHAGAYVHRGAEPYAVEQAGDTDPRSRKLADDDCRGFAHEYARAEGRPPTWPHAGSSDFAPGSASPARPDL